MRLQNTDAWLLKAEHTCGYGQDDAQCCKTRNGASSGHAKVFVVELTIAAGLFESLITLKCLQGRRGTTGAQRQHSRCPPRSADARFRHSCLHISSFSAFLFSMKFRKVTLLLVTIPLGPLPLPGYLSTSSFQNRQFAMELFGESGSN